LIPYKILTTIFTTVFLKEYLGRILEDIRRIK